jgi:DNA polymerase-3 subunit gamma/tau
MERFVVSARKYRPITFSTVVGQEHVTGTLKNAVRNQHVAQAFLFTGPRGVGKTTCARILARTINCENLQEDLTTCGSCPSCQTFEEGHSLNIFELDAASNNSVDDIRNLIQQVQIAPQVGSRKVYIIDEVHMLTQAAFNAFLKTLEEPPSYAIFILATTEKHKVLPTILSRCQVFDFRRITVKDIADHLAAIAKQEGIAAETQALLTIARKADGGLRDALSIFDQLVSFSGERLTYADVVKNLNVLDQEYYFQVTDHLLDGDAPGALQVFNEVLFQGFDGHFFVAGLARHFRDLLVCQDPRTIPLLEAGEDVAARYAGQAARTTPGQLVAGLERISAADTVYKSSKEPRLLVETALILMARDWAVPVRTASAERPVAASSEKKKPEPRLNNAPAQADQADGPASNLANPSDGDIPVTPAPMRGKRLAGGISIQQQLAPPSAPDKKTALADVPGPEPETDGNRQPINQALLLKAWNDYAMARKRDGKNSLHATLTANKPLITGPATITLTIVNDVQENYLREVKPELLGHLRRELGLPRLELSVEKAELADLRPRYTARDRFAIMAENNPALLKLRDELDLDLG